MWMELRGKKAADDFLLLYDSKDPSAFNLQDSRLPPPTRGFHLKTQDLLPLLEKKRADRGEGESDGTAPTTTERERQPTAEHVLPGGIGTYSISHVSLLSSSSRCGGAAADDPQPERRTCDVVGGDRAEGKPEPYHCHSNSNGRYGPYSAGAGPPQWGESAATDSGSTVDLSVKADGRGIDQKQPTTPRSKHSATEQRRRSKINDRFQILRDLLPHNDQKRDKASFLLEVIEYIRFLQEKVHKYEAYPGWNQENAKLMPWKLPRDSIIDHPDVIKNGPSVPGYMFSGKFDDNGTSVSPTMLSNAHNPTESELSAGVPYKAVDTPGFSIKEAAMPVPMQTNLYDNMATQSRSQWLRSLCPADCTVNSATLNDQEELAIDEGTMSVSGSYSQELLTMLTQSLQSSGIDLSQASIAVQINLGKRAIRRPAATTRMPNAKDHDDPLSGTRAMEHSSSDEESEQAPKRHKSDNS